MRHRVVVAALVLLGGLLLSPGSAHAEPGLTGPPHVSGAVSGGAYLFLPFLVPFEEVGAEVVVGDRVAFGGKALLTLGYGGGTTLVPYVALGSPRSRSAAGYVSVSWLPRSPLGALGLGYEATLSGPVRLYGEAGVVGDLGGGGFLPYGHLGVRVRF
jgi:hypothetical protein